MGVGHRVAPDQMAPAPAGTRHQKRSAAPSIRRHRRELVYLHGVANTGSGLSAVSSCGLAGGGLTEAVGPAAAVGFLPTENDQDVLGNLFVDPNAATQARGQLFQDR